MNVSISICPTDMEVGGDRYDEAALLAAIREYVAARLGEQATITTLQVGHRQGEAWATIDGDSESGLSLVDDFFSEHGTDEELFVPVPPPVMVEVATGNETIRICGGLDDYMEHPAIAEACEAYHRAATDALTGAGRLNWCAPSGQRVLHSQWMGAKFGYRCGALGTMATDLTDDEKAAISAADDAGREAALKVIAAAE